MPSADYPSHSFGQHSHKFIEGSLFIFCESNLIALSGERIPWPSWALALNWLGRFFKLELEKPQPWVCCFATHISPSNSTINRAISPEVQPPNSQFAKFPNCKTTQPNNFRASKPYNIRSLKPYSFRTSKLCLIVNILIGRSRSKFFLLQLQTIAVKRSICFNGRLRSFNIRRIIAPHAQLLNYS